MGRLFTLLIKLNLRRLIMANKDTKVLVSIGGAEFVLSADKAVEVLEMFSGAERYEHYVDWKSSGPREESHHIWEEHTIVNLKSLPLGLYQCAKLAGKKERS
jgi:hypothetical protein